MSLKAPKPFLTYDMQLDNLTSKKGLIIHDFSFALSKLENIGYYTLIDGYKNLFYNPMTRQYESGTTFNDIVALYDFDQKLRILLFQYICIIEQHLRSMISYHFCETYTEHQSAYLNPNNYNNIPKNRIGIQKLLHILSNEANVNIEHPYIVYQRNTYRNVPLWVVLNTLTLGQTSKMYSYLTSSLQSKISGNLDCVNEKELGQYLKVLTVFRNVCAHNERLFSFRSRFEIPDTKLHKKLLIPQNGNHYAYGKSDLFSIIITFRHLLTSEDFSKFKRAFSVLLTNFEKESSPAKKDKLLSAMGVPNNWKSISRYHLS